MGETLQAPAGKEIIETAVASGIIQGLTIILEDLEYVLQRQYEDALEEKRKAEEEGEENV